MNTPKPIEAAVPLAVAARLLRMTREQCLRRMMRGEIPGFQDPISRHYYITTAGFRDALVAQGIVPTPEAMTYLDPTLPMPMSPTTLAPTE